MTVLYDWMDTRTDSYFSERGGTSQHVVLSRHHMTRMGERNDTDVRQHSYYIRRDGRRGAHIIV